ncbi:RagB/SusD family nutrient uptake outer membrane protein [Flavitalea sp. BT771]|uniref:RagB/SusD family nutrient uptake outer membrane protein n=1 Tax=Flavitalea sp. BT771 TaxID=3063329 RepID=UPI0026E37AA3|nr:RagB/SusD family nutrient uptake outer membrane protein [Flavitalea sp. BT771]MDO6429013.1 RagB/SusD family nutrient uptake outer membrane protein [Flavitalea sp. BT771]MDV6218859.1 RagB/SusD family nutrient uptake outer membrane protein [Flavitalea sp. BT771]
MRSKKYLLYVALGCLLVPLACSRNFLNQKDTSNASEEALFKTPQDGISLVNAIYDGFQHDNQSFVLKALWYNANYCSQDFFNWGADVSYNTYLFPTDFGSTAQFWNLSYQGISRANSAIPIIAKMHDNKVIGDSLANFLTGQAYFLRGVFYYYLACTFGGVPLELNVVTNGLHPRASQDSVFLQVVADMTAASGLLPWPENLPPSDLGRATRGAAFAYMGAAQMWLKKYSDAVATFNQVIPHYQLMSNYMDIHEYNHQNNQESIFELQFSLPGGVTPDWSYNNNEVTWNSSFMWPWETSNFGYTYANKKLYTSFEAGDLRKAATIIGPDDTIASPGIVAIGGIKNYAQVKAGFAGTLSLPKSHFTGTDGKIINTCGKTGDLWTGDQPGQPRSGYYGMKFWRDPNVSGNTPSAADGKTHIFGDQNVTMLRLSEVLLDKAEAQFKSNDAAGATATLQTVRDRAWGGAAPPSPFGPDFMQMMLQEYRHELAGDMSLWYDLRRTGLHIQYIKDNFGIDIPSGHDLLPIPQSAIATNPTLKQNPNY